MRLQPRRTNGLRKFLELSGYRPVRPQWAIYAVLAWLGPPDRRVGKSKMGDGEGGSGGREPGLDPLHGRNADPGFAGDLANTLSAGL